MALGDRPWINPGSELDEPDDYGDVLNFSESQCLRVQNEVQKRHLIKSSCALASMHLVHSMGTFSFP